MDMTGVRSWIVGVHWQKETARFPGYKLERYTACIAVPSWLFDIQVSILLGVLFNIRRTSHIGAVEGTRIYFWRRCASLIAG